MALGTPDESEPASAAVQVAATRLPPGGAIRRFVLPALELCLVAAVLVGTWLMMTDGWKLLSQDVTEYFRYAQLFWLHHPRFRALPVEYPPLAIVPFSLTLLPASADHHLVFAFWMGLLVVLGYVAYRRYSTRRAGLAWVMYLLLGTSAVFLARYDLVPALVTLVALWAAARRRYSLAYILLGLGVLLKLYPAFLLPVVAIEQWRVLGGPPQALAGGAGRWLRAVARQPAARAMSRGVGLFVAVVVVGFGVALALNAHGTLSEFRFAADRPIQVESVPATLMWIGSAFGPPLHAVFSFGAYNAVGPLARVLASLSSLALIAGCCWVYWRQTRGNLTLAQAMLACLCMVVVTNKLLSAQYLIWVLPFVAEVEGFDFIWIAICLLTTLEYPIIFDASFRQWTMFYTTPYLFVLALRNGLLVVATLRAVLRSRSAPVAQLDAGGTLTAQSGVEEAVAHDASRAVAHNHLDEEM